MGALMGGGGRGVPAAAWEGARLRGGAGQEAGGGGRDAQGCWGGRLRGRGAFARGTAVPVTSVLTLAGVAGPCEGLPVKTTDPETASGRVAGGRARLAGTSAVDSWCCSACRASRASELVLSLRSGRRPAGRLCYGARALVAERKLARLCACFRLGEVNLGSKQEASPRSPTRPP